MKKLTFVKMVFALLIAPETVMADKVEAANKAAKDNFGQFVQKHAQDEAFREALPANGFRNFGAWVSGQKKEGRQGDDAVRGRSDGHRRDGRGGSGGDDTTSTNDDGSDGGDTLGGKGKGNGRGRGPK